MKSTDTKLNNKTAVKKGNGANAVIALAGNPNVGKSTLFNSLTGMKQHTGNWPGKTVGTAQGCYKGKKGNYTLVDIPGTYSLLSHSDEEECARNFICFEAFDAVVAVCDACCLERNLNLVLQITEVSEKALVCVNLMDEAERRGVKVDLKLLSKRLGIPVVGTTARNRKSLSELKSEIEKIDETEVSKRNITEYPLAVEAAVSVIVPVLKNITKERINCRWLGLRILCEDTEIIKEAENRLGIKLTRNGEVTSALAVAFSGLEAAGIKRNEIKDIIAKQTVKKARDICKGAVTYVKKEYDYSDRKKDRVLTGKYTTYPIMLLLLAVVFWITVVGANYPSEWLSALFSKIEILLNRAFSSLYAPDWLRGVILDGAYRVLSWVVAVMLPPMAIFFPFFTLLEDSGYLPRIAYNLDRPFKSCSACGKQALTTCMGFGCNAVGITGCRIIDSKRERMLAILTNSFIPCNGRFPALISVISMFFVGASGAVGSFYSAVILSAVIVFCVVASLAASKLLSKTVLRGEASAFTLELPPYRRPKIGEVIVRSVLDRTLFVLGRAVCVAVPAGTVIWLAANISISGQSLLLYCSDFLDPMGRLMGLDGVILIAFILGFPANEIVIPIMLMAYTSSGTLSQIGSISAVREILTANGWNETTAICVIIFLVMHWPCSTTLITVKKETGSIKWTLAAFLLPTLFGAAACMMTAFMCKLLF